MHIPSHSTGWCGWSVRSVIHINIIISYLLLKDNWWSYLLWTCLAYLCQLRYDPFWRPSRYLTDPNGTLVRSKANKRTRPICAWKAAAVPKAKRPSLMATSWSSFLLSFTLDVFVGLSGSMKHAHVSGSPGASFVVFCIKSRIIQSLPSNLGEHAPTALKSEASLSSTTSSWGGNLHYSGPNSITGMNQGMRW